MEAPRLVFVSVKNAKPRRKVAVPIPDAYTWGQFCEQIQTKLKLRGVSSVYLVSTLLLEVRKLHLQSGEKVTTLDDLQDIDELHVEEAAATPPSPTASANGPSPNRTSSGSKASASDRYANSHTEAPSPKARSQQRQTATFDTHDRASEPEQKYSKRSSGVRRSLQRVLPSLFGPKLPVTVRDVTEDSRKDGRQRRRRRRDSWLAPRNLLRVFGLLVFLLVLLLLYSRMVPKMD